MRRPGLNAGCHQGNSSSPASISTLHMIYGGPVFKPARCFVFKPTIYHGGMQMAGDFREKGCSDARFTETVAGNAEYVITHLGSLSHVGILMKSRSRTATI